MIIRWLVGYVHIDWVARDREIRRQLREGIIDMDRINVAAKITVR